MAMRARKDRPGLYVFWRDADGRRHQKRCKNKTEAQTVLRNELAARDRGEPALFVKSRKTVEEFAAEYLRRCEATWAPSEADRVRRMLAVHLLPYFGKMRLSDVRRSHVEEYRAMRAKEPATTWRAKHNGENGQEGAPTEPARDAGESKRPVKLTAPSTINKELRRLGHLFSKAIEWDVVRRNPVRGIKPLKEPPARVAFLEPEQRARLLAEAEAFSPTFRDLLIFAMHTGARLSEILNLTVSGVDLRRRLLTFTKTKSGKVRHIPISPDLYRVLERLNLPADPTAPLFPDWKRAQVTTAFRRVAKRAGLPGFRFHDLRHDFASWLTMGGVNIRGVQMLLGHADLRMTERYSHLAEQVLRAAVATLPRALPEPAPATIEIDVTVPAAQAA